MPNPDEFMKVYDAHVDAIFRHCYFRVFDRERARDLVQETFLKTWEYLAQGRKIENIRAFLYRVATNLIIDGSRRKKEISLEQLSEAGFDPAAEEKEDITALLDWDFLLKKLEDLEPLYREALVMRYVDDMSVKEIAEATGEKQNTISVRLHRAAGKLKQLIAKQYAR